MLRTVGPPDQGSGRSPIKIRSRLCATLPTGGGRPSAGTRGPPFRSRRCPVPAESMTAVVLTHVPHHLAERSKVVPLPCVRAGDRGRARALPEAHLGALGDVLAEGLVRLSSLGDSRRRGGDSGRSQNRNGDACSAVRWARCGVHGLGFPSRSPRAGGPRDATLDTRGLMSASHTTVRQPGQDSGGPGSRLGQESARLDRKAERLPVMQSAAVMHT